MTVDAICAKTKSAIGISRGVLLITKLFSAIIRTVQKNAMAIVIAKVIHILLNSKSSEVLPAKTRGTEKKRA